MKLTVRSQADRDIAGAIQFYLNEHTVRSATRFTDALDLAYDSILEAPSQPRVVEHGFREKKLKKFPYSILYSIEDS